jgi:hypothetical protein
LNKAELIQDLQNNVYARLKPSPRGGIGIFAIRNIPEGIKPLGSYQMRFCKIPLAEIRKNRRIPWTVKRYVEDMCVVKDGCIWLPTCGINGIRLDFFFNHFKRPNLRYDKYNEFITTRAVRADLELTVDYESYNDDRGF